MHYCKMQLATLAAHNPSMKRAVDNLIADCRDGARNLHGNIPEAVQADIEHDCTGHGPAETRHLEEVFARRRAIDDGTHYCPASPPPEDLRRCMSLTSFAFFNIATTSFDAKGSAHEILDTLSSPGPRDIGIEKLQGYTARKESPCWWTWHTDQAGAPSNGAIYMAELAIGAGECERAKHDGWVVAIRLPPRNLGAPLYKPSALDGFAPDSPFAPDLTGSPCGWTSPSGGAGLRPRPELVSRSVAYKDLDLPGDKLQLTLYAF